MDFVLRVCSHPLRRLLDLYFLSFIHFLLTNLHRWFAIVDGQLSNRLSRVGQLYPARILVHVLLPHVDMTKLLITVMKTLCHAHPVRFWRANYALAERWMSTTSDALRRRFYVVNPVESKRGSSFGSFQMLIAFRLLDCGFHKCKRSCHGDACGPCPSICGKPRKLWQVDWITTLVLFCWVRLFFSHPDNHPCTLPCHAPSICNESEPCTATVTVTCPCSRFQQPTKCGKSFSNPNRNAPQLQCRDECAIAKRNAKLAEALGISPDRKEKPNVVYSDELVAFAKANIKFLAAVENTLNE